MIVTAQVGDFSDPDTWVGGIVPDALDTIQLAHDVNADIDVSVNAIADGASGGLLVTSSRLINVTNTLERPNWSMGVDKGVIDVAMSSGMEVTLNVGHIKGALGYGNFVFRGRIVNTKGSNGTLNVNALITGAGGTNLGPTYGGRVVYLQAAGSVNNISGIIRAETDQWNSYLPPIESVGGGKTINISGILEAGRSVVITNGVNDTVLIDGVSQSSGTHAVSESGGVYAVSGIVINNDVQAYRVLRLLLNGDVMWQFNTPTIGVTANLYTAGQAFTGHPPQSKVQLGEVFGPVGEFTGTLNPVNIDVQQLASNLLTEMNASNLAIAQGLRDGMGASAAAIAAVGSINVIP